MNKASDILTQAISEIENSNNVVWTKGVWLTKTKIAGEPKCMACAHGIISYLGDPTVKDNFEKDNMVSARFQVHNNYRSGAPYIIDLGSSTAVVLAHRYLRRIGIDVSLNDNSFMSKEIIISKFKEATQLALTENN